MFCCLCGVSGILAFTILHNSSVHEAHLDANTFLFFSLRTTIFIRRMENLNRYSFKKHVNLFCSLFPEDILLMMNFVQD